MIPIISWTKLAGSSSFGASKVVTPEFCAVGESAISIPSLKLKLPCFLKSLLGNMHRRLSEHPEQLTCFSCRGPGNIHRVDIDRLPRHTNVFPICVPVRPILDSYIFCPRVDEIIWSRIDIVRSPAAGTTSRQIQRTYLEQETAIWGNLPASDPGRNLLD